MCPQHLLTCEQQLHDAAAKPGILYCDQRESSKNR